MRIACPDCNAVYELPPDRVRPGRGVKCAKCGTIWVPVATVDAEPEIQPAPEPSPPPVPVPEVTVAEPVPPPEPVVEPVRPPRRLPVLLAWVASILVLGGLAWFAATHRAAVIAAWPPAERAYVWLGLT